MLTVGMYLADRYEIVGKVGAGGMSDVYKAKDHILGRFVAIKVLKQEYSEDRNFVAKFRSEAQSAAGLEHPNIVNIYDVGSEEGLYYIVMEYVEGITLKTYVEKKGQLTFKEAISIAIQVARGIESAHNKNIIHRDIKPQNIIISTEGKVKVTDFGIARAASSNTISSDVMGSVHYASPEQARNGFVDNRSDIYSLGIVMYEMVTGRVPFDGDTTVAVAIQHLQEEMVIPSVYAQNLPISLEKIILKCAQKNPDRRYQSMAELLADLRKSLMNPDEDFVVIAPLVDNGKTKVIREEDISKIKESSNTVTTSDVSEVESLDEKKTEPKAKYDDDEDDEDEGILNPKMDKAVTIMGIIVAAIIVIVIIYFMGSLFGLFKFGKKPATDIPSTETQQTEVEIDSQQQTPTVEQVAMVNVIGMSQDVAINQITGLGLFVSISVEESDQEAGTILKQSVDEGAMVDKGSYIELVISGGSSVKMVTLTDLTGKTEADAVTLLTGLGLVPDKNYEFSEEIAAGLVISQDPSNGFSVAEGSTVKLVISQGRQAITVPNVIGKDQNTAVAELTAAGLTVAVAQEYSDAAVAGTIIGQSIEANKTVEFGQEITIAVSMGSTTSYYSCSYQLAVPDGVTSADITLFDGSGNVLSNWNRAAVQGGNTYTISKAGIAGSSAGTIKVTWYSATTDADGNTQETSSSETYAVTFTKQ